MRSARPDYLFDAVNAGDVARVQGFLAAGADVNETGLAGTPLHLAMSTGQVGIAVMVIDAGADLEGRGDPAGAHPLHLAAYGNLPEAMKLLIDRGAEVDARDAEERTALSIAAAFGHAGLGQMLLDRGATPTFSHWDPAGDPCTPRPRRGICLSPGCSCRAARG